MKRPITFIVVDDDRAAIDHIADLVRPFKNWKLIAVFTDPAKALDYLASHHVDFVLLDMEMPHIDGRAFMLQMPTEVKVILYTAYDQYATDGFDYGVIDFLKKPVSMERLNKAMKRMGEALKFNIADGPAIKGDYYYFMLRGPVKSVRTMILLDELVYIESKNDKTYFYLVGEMEPDGTGGPVMTWNDPNKPLGKVCSERLHELRNVLMGTSIMQIHRSILFNNKYYDTYGKHGIKLKGLSLVLPVGKRENYREFYDWMDKHHLPNG